MAASNAHSTRYVSIIGYRSAKAYTYVGGLGLSYTEAQSENFDALIEAKVFKPYRTKTSGASIAPDVDAVAKRVMTMLVPELQGIATSMADNIIAQLKPLIATSPPSVQVSNTSFSFYITLRSYFFGHRENMNDVVHVVIVDVNLNRHAFTIQPLSLFIFFRWAKKYEQSKPRRFSCEASTNARPQNGSAETTSMLTLLFLDE